MLRNPILIAGLIAGLLGTHAGAATTAPELAAEHQPTDAELGFQTRSMRLVHGLLSDKRYSLRVVPLDDTVEPTFAAYIDTLDEQRMFFSAADLRDLGKARAGIRDAIEGKNLDPAYAVFADFVARVDARTAFARARLTEPADYAAAGTWIPDRSELPREADQAALDDAWRRMVRNDRLELHLAGQSEEAIRSTLDARYADVARRVHELRPMDVFGAFANAYAIAVDPGGGYLAPLDSSEPFQGEAGHAGLGMVVKREYPYSVVQSVVPGGPAELGGVLAGERILAIAEEPGEWTDMVGLRLDTVVEGLRGKAGTRLRLRLGTPSGASREVALTRAFVRLEEQAAKQSVVTAGGRRIGVITLPSFYMDFEAVRRGDADARSAAGDVGKRLGELRALDVDGVLLDLRGNGGGALAQSVEVAALFLGRRPVVQIREAGGRVSVESGDKDAAWAGPLAVLVDHESAAASEIVAAALQDHGRARVLGERTFGRGSVQNLIDLGKFSAAKTGGSVKLTIAEFFRVDGRAIGAVGVEPDLPLPDATAAAPLENAAKAARIPAAPGFEPPAKAPMPASAAMSSDPAVAAWRERWQRARALRTANQVALDAATRRVANAAVAADAEAARTRDDALQAAALAFADGLKGAAEPAE